MRGRNLYLTSAAITTTILALVWEALLHEWLAIALFVIVFGGIVAGFIFTLVCGLLSDGQD
jgi:hypothetical protein